MDKQKQDIAIKALDFIRPGMSLGIGTGSTVDFFIQAIIDAKIRPKTIICSSKASQKQLEKHNVYVEDINNVREIDIYVDGADQINSIGQMIKGGGGAHTLEKLCASLAKQIICIAHYEKTQGYFGRFPIAIEVIPAARSFVARQIVHLGGTPKLRENQLTDNNNYIIDAHNINMNKPILIETKINSITGVLENGVFSINPANILITTSEDGSIILKNFN